jgi:hypothetical protein
MRNPESSSSGPSSRYPARSLCLETRQASSRKRARTAAGNWPHSGPLQTDITGTSSNRSRRRAGIKREEMPLERGRSSPCKRLPVRATSPKPARRSTLALLEPAGSHESSPYREVTPDSGAQRSKRNQKTRICGKTPPSRTPRVHVGTRQSQLSRSQQLKPCPGKENFEDRRTFVISTSRFALRADSRSIALRVESPNRFQPLLPRS